MTQRPYPKYRPSGDDWLGSVPEHWGVKPLKRTASFNDDVLSETTDPEYEIEYVDIGGVSLERGIENTEAMPFGKAPSRARRTVKDGDVIVSTVRTYLKAIAPIRNSPSNLVVSTGFAVVRPRDGLHPSFASYGLQASYFMDEVLAHSTGVSYPAINASEMMCFKIPIPPPNEQQAVVRFLDREAAKLDTLIAKQERLIELLQEKRQAAISHAVTKGLDPKAPMKDSGVEWLGEMPAHWTAKRLKFISPFITVGIVVNPSTYVADEGLPFIYGGDIAEGQIDAFGARRISDADSRRNQKTRLAAGDLVTVRVGAPGITAVVPKECEGGNCASVMLVRKGSYDSDWLCYAMNSSMVRDQVSVVQYGAAQEQFNISHAINFWVATPPRNEQLEIAAYLGEAVGKLDGLMKHARRSIDLMREHRSALISAAVTGKIDVRSHAGIAQDLAPVAD